MPFNRVSFEAFIGQKLIDDYINYDIYTDILMGTPPQKVTHFIEPNESIFQFKRRTLQYNDKKLIFLLLKLSRIYFLYLIQKNLQLILVIILKYLYLTHIITNQK